MPEGRARYPLSFKGKLTEPLPRWSRLITRQSTRRTRFAMLRGASPELSRGHLRCLMTDGNPPFRLRE